MSHQHNAGLPGSPARKSVFSFNNSRLKTYYIPTGVTLEADGAESADVSKQFLSAMRLVPSPGISPVCSCMLIMKGALSLRSCTRQVLLHAISSM